MLKTKSNTTVSEKLQNLLFSNEKYLAENIEGEKVLNKTLVSVYAREYNAELLALLHSDEDVKKHFFVQIKKVSIFKLEHFLVFINNRSFLPDSFTAFKQKIGLATDKENYLENNRDVVLNWAYKDCVLEGGQSKDDQKRSEVFFNEVLAPDQINRLLDDKVFVNWKKYDKNGEHKVTELKENDNLIVKGNNLVVLHSLRKRFAGQVKLIYIDPPYNTGNDSFGYNDRFNHSTWLTFMKNRLEVAKELLSDDGSIFVQIDHNEAHYLKCLMDEIFGRERFINEIIWCYTGPGSPHMRQFNRKHDNIFWYSKTEKWIFIGDDVRVPYRDPNQSLRKAFDDGSGWTQEDLEELRSRGKVPEDWWDDIAISARLRVDGVRRTGYLTEKPLKLLERIIKCSTNENDLVLDFFAGSGTTLYACALNKRRFIGIEQLENTQDLLLRRMQVTCDFVYCELANDAENFRKEVNRAKAANLLELLEKAKDSSFLSYQVDRDKFNGFENLSEKEQRELLFQLVDANTLYVNYSDIESEDYAISKADKELNRQFYGRS